MKEDFGTTTSSTLSNQPTGDQRTGNVEGYVREAIAQFLKDPPDTDGDIEVAWQLTLQSELDRKGDRK